MWYEFNVDNESLDEYRARRLKDCPGLTPIQLEVLVQLSHAVWDGYIISKSSRSDLVDLGLVTRYNGWQIVTQEGLAVLDTLGKLPTKYTSKDS